MRIKELNTKAEGLIETGRNLELRKIRCQDSLNEANSSLSDAHFEVKNASRIDEDGNYMGDVKAAKAYLAEVRCRIEYIEAEIKECDYEIERNKNEKRDTYDDIDDMISKEDHNIRLLKELQTKNFSKNANAVLADLIARLNSGEREKDRLNESMGETAPGIRHSGGGMATSPSIGGGQSSHGGSGTAPIAAHSAIVEDKPNTFAEHANQEKSVPDQICREQADNKEKMKPIMVMAGEWVQKEAGCKTPGHEKSENLREITDFNSLFVQSEQGNNSQSEVNSAYCMPKQENEVIAHTPRGIRAEGGSGAKGEQIKFGSDTKSATKLNNQMDKRGWTENTVRDAVSEPYTKRVSINKATGNSATVYYNKSGGYVIVDDVTNAIVQVSDNINPSTWAPDPSIVDPYLPVLPK